MCNKKSSKLEEHYLCTIHTCILSTNSAQLYCAQAKGIKEVENIMVVCKDQRSAQIGKSLRALRGDTPRKEVAFSLGISLSALAMYERGERIPRDEVKKRIAAYFRTTVEEIFYAS